MHGHRARAHARASILGRQTQVAVKDLLAKAPAQAVAAPILLLGCKRSTGPGDSDAGQETNAATCFDQCALKRRYDCAPGDRRGLRMGGVRPPEHSPRVLDYRMPKRAPGAEVRKRRLARIASDRTGRSLPRSSTEDAPAPVLAPAARQFMERGRRRYRRIAITGSPEQHRWSWRPPTQMSASRPCCERGVTTLRRGHKASHRV